ncbi:MAG: hypothetical protein WC878_02405 [Candidatus Paceibacterota bacterium]|jgi:hypothetical protein
MRLSIEKASRKTAKELERKFQGWLAKKPNVGLPKEMVKDHVNVILHLTILDDLLHGMHVITFKEKDNLDRARNNVIEQLGREFPDLIIG